MPKELTQADILRKAAFASLEGRALAPEGMVAAADKSRGALQSSVLSRAMAPIAGRARELD